MKKSRYTLIYGFFIYFLIVSFILRTTFLVISFTKADLGFIDIIKLYAKGFIFDIAVATFFCLAYSIYLLVLPQKFNNSRFNRWITYIGLFVTILITMFSFFAEVTFWEEFECRFNFIAVDYLVYTYEVVNNINQSYPLPLLIGGMVLGTVGIIWIFHRFRLFEDSFKSKTFLLERIFRTGVLVIASVIFILWLPNSWADNNHNRYQNELSKAGIYSFFAAFKNNELDYNTFYLVEDEVKIFRAIHDELEEPGITWNSSNEGKSIKRYIDNSYDFDVDENTTISVQPVMPQPNVILITIESFSADFMGRFGNTEGLTPNIDSLAKNSILFTNLYATGTRTVRGMEALTLSVPPTPGSSIVRRPNNDGLFNVSTVFNAKGYKSSFIYGGDGYFDNMNAFFGNNGYDIIDRGRNITSDKMAGTRTIILDEFVTYENAWGLCDADIYSAAIRDADEKYNNNQPFFQFVMTTSNHRPFTYPEGKIDIPSGSGRHGAVKYTDYAIGDFIEKIKNKPWFENTVIVIVADHCASSAGKNEIDVSKYHIPCLFYNLKQNDSITTIDKQCSQLDIFPTLFALLGWNYESQLYGKNVLHDSYRERTFMGTYQKLGYVQNDTLIILSPQWMAEAYLLNASKTEQQAIPMDDILLQRAIAYYQSAFYLFKSGGMKVQR